MTKLIELIWSLMAFITSPIDRWLMWLRQRWADAKFRDVLVKWGGR